LTPNDSKLVVTPAANFRRENFPRFSRSSCENRGTGKTETKQAKAKRKEQKEPVTEQIKLSL